MAITFNALQTLIGTSSGNAGVYGLYTNANNNTDTTSALFGAGQKTEATLSESQQATITQLEDYVNENLSGTQAEALLKDIEGLSQLMKFGNSDSSFSALSQLLGGDSGLTSSLSSGSLINQLV
jgi:hypothetical protein